MHVVASKISLTNNQRPFEMHCGRKLSAHRSGSFWDNRLRTTRTLAWEIPGKLKISSENIDRIRQMLQQSSWISMRTARKQQQVPRSTAHGVVHNQLSLKSIKFDCFMLWKPTDQVACLNFIIGMLARGDSQICFSDEAMFDVWKHSSFQYAPRTHLISICWSSVCYPSYFIKLSSIKLGHHYTSATLLGITRTPRCKWDGFTGACKPLCLLGHQTPCQCTFSHGVM